MSSPLTRILSFLHAFLKSKGMDCSRFAAVLDYIIGQGLRLVKVSVAVVSVYYGQYAEPEGTRKNKRQKRDDGRGAGFLL